MNRWIPVILIASVVFGTIEALPARAQMSGKEVVSVRAAMRLSF